jgi:hypothetical protein
MADMYGHFIRSEGRYEAFLHFYPHGAAPLRISRRLGHLWILSTVRVMT